MANFSAPPNTPSVDHDAGVRVVKSAERTVAILEYLALAEGPRSMRQIADDLHLPRASAYALLMTLIRTRWVEAARDASGFRLGARAMQLTASYAARDNIVQIVQPVIQELSQQLDETVHLARLDGSDIVYLFTCRSRHSLAASSKQGATDPSWATALGKAMLAERDWENVEETLPPVLDAFTPDTLTDRTLLRADLARTRERGYAVDAEESTRGLRCYAVALHYSTPPLEAISCSVPVARLDAEREAAIIDALVAAKAELSPQP